MPRDPNLNFRLPAERWEELRVIARRDGRTVSGLVRFVLERYLDGAAGSDLRQLSDERAARLMSGRSSVGSEE